MKKLVLAGAALAALIAGPAMAADLPVKAAPIVPIYDWTGFYIGINGGYSWGRSNTTVSYFNTITGAPIIPPAGSITDAGFNLDGGVFGGQIGYNWQFSSWLFGLEADAQWSGQKGSAAFLCSAAGLLRRK